MYHKIRATGKGTKITKNNRNHQLGHLNSSNSLQLILINFFATLSPTNKSQSIGKSRKKHLDAVFPPKNTEYAGNY